MHEYLFNLPCHWISITSARKSIMNTGCISSKICCFVNWVMFNVITVPFCWFHRVHYCLVDDTSSITLPLVKCSVITFCFPFSWKYNLRFNCCLDIIVYDNSIEITIEDNSSICTFLIDTFSDFITIFHSLPRLSHQIWQTLIPSLDVIHFHLNFMKDVNTVVIQWI